MAGLHDALAFRVAPTDLQSLLMGVYWNRAQDLKAPALLENTVRNSLLSPSSVSARKLLEFDCVAFAAAANFEALDLSPVGPFGASFTLGGTSQNNVVTAVRNAEALGDSTIAMALECAKRRRHSADVVRLCASHRVIRLQPVNVPGFTPHFRLFAMVTAGRDSGSPGFEFEQLREHLRVYLSMFRDLAGAGLQLTEPLVEITDLAGVEAVLRSAGVQAEEIRESVRAHWPGGSERFLTGRGIGLSADARHEGLEHEVFGPLREEFPEAVYRVNQTRLEGIGYYRGFAMRISPVAPDHERYAVVDGGFTDWTARLLSNAKERLLVSGLGSEFTCKKYQPREASSMMVRETTDLVSGTL